MTIPTKVRGAGDDLETLASSTTEDVFGGEHASNAMATGSAEAIREQRGMAEDEQLGAQAEHDLSGARLDPEEVARHSVSVDLSEELTMPDLAMLLDNIAHDMGTIGRFTLTLTGLDKLPGDATGDVTLEMGYSHTDDDHAALFIDQASSKGACLDDFYSGNEELGEGTAFFRRQFVSRENAAFWLLETLDDLKISIVTPRDQKRQAAAATAQNKLDFGMTLRDEAYAASYSGVQDKHHLEICGSAAGLRNQAGASHDLIREVVLEGFETLETVVPESRTRQVTEDLLGSLTQALNNELAAGMGRGVNLVFDWSAIGDNGGSSFRASVQPTENIKEEIAPALFENESERAGGEATSKMLDEAGIEYVRGVFLESSNDEPWEDYVDQHRGEMLELIESFTNRESQYYQQSVADVFFQGDEKSYQDALDAIADHWIAADDRQVDAAPTVEHSMQVVRSMPTQMTVRNRAQLRKSMAELLGLFEQLVSTPATLAALFNGMAGQGCELANLEVLAHSCGWGDRYIDILSAVAHVQPAAAPTPAPPQA